MFITTKKVAATKYVAPASDFCNVLADALICESGNTEDWVYDDDNSF